MNAELYNFEAPQAELLIDGQPQTGQSRLLEILDDPNRAPAYAQLHLGEVASGAQAIVFYEQDDSTGTAVIERTSTTSGSHDWRLRDTRMTAEGPHYSEQASAHIATQDADGFMNRHLFLQPGNTLLTTQAEPTARLRTLGTIMAVHLVQTPHQMQRSIAALPVSPDAAQEFAKAA